MKKMIKFDYYPPGTLLIGSWNTVCNNCGRDCNPYEEKHETNLGYNEEIRKQPGCGITFTHYVSTYYGDEVGRSVKRMRPDLEFIDIMESLNAT